MKYMEEKNIKKLWYVCTIIQNYCEAHNGCDFCPFHDYWDDCMIKNAAGVSTDELWKLFPENITEGE